MNIYYYEQQQYLDFSNEKKIEDTEYSEDDDKKLKYNMSITSSSTSTLINGTYLHQVFSFI